jgi:hypothetical protein
VVVLGGRRLSERAPRIQLDGHLLDNGRRSGNWGIFEAELSDGPHLLELPSLADGADPEAEYVYFAAIVHADRAGAYLGLGRAPGPAGATGQASPAAP